MVNHENQYVGDIGDYGKYSLLRVFSEAGIRVGVNWYLTENDNSNDGKFTSYLQKEDMRCKDPVVFDALKKIAHKAGKSVKDIQRSGIIKNALFYDKKLDGKGTPSERDRNRNKWLFESMEELSDAELIFMNPDNGLLESNDASKLSAEKYVIPDEVELYFNAGHNVVYYCHKGRRTDDVWQKYKNTMFERIPSAKPAIITFHKGSQRSYVFLIHEKDFVKYRKIIDSFMRGWSGIFSEEYTSKGDPASNVSGGKILLRKADGTVVTLQQRADGQIRIESSANPGTEIIMPADLICKLLGV